MDTKAHKPALAIAALLCCINGFLLYLSSPDKSGDGGLGLGEGKHESSEVQPFIKADSLSRFNIRAQKIFYQRQEISFERFEEIIDDLNHRGERPELVFELPLTSGFYEKVKKYLTEHRISFREEMAIPDKEE